MQRRDFDQTSRRQMNAVRQEHIRATTMRTIRSYAAGGFVALALMLACGAHAEDQGTCAETLQSEAIGLIALLPEGGTPMHGVEMTTLEIQGRITACVRSGRCQFFDQLTIYAEMTLDEQIVSLQRAKISAIRSFFGTTREAKDSCVLLKSLPSLHARLNEVNSRQLSRLKMLADARLPLP